MAIGRRQVLQLGAAGAGGWLVALALRRVAPIGRDVGDTALVERIQRGDGVPASGPADASLRLAVFSDYRCGACRAAFPALEAAVRDDGDVRVVYKDWPIFGGMSVDAARVALASAGQGIYAAVHRALMTEPRPLTGEVLRAAVLGAGGDWARLVADLTGNAAAIADILRSNGREAQALGLTGTLGYLAGSIVTLGALDRAGFARLFEQARA